MTGAAVRGTGGRSGHGPGGPTRRTTQDREIVRLAVPAFLALVAEPLFLLADAAIVGHLGTPQLAGLGIASAVLGTLVSLCIFLAYGTTASVARQVGAGDTEGALAQGVDGLWLAALIGVVVTRRGAAGDAHRRRLFGPSADVATHATTYLHVALLGAAPLLLMLAATGVLRGLQDTRTPLVVAVVGNVANVVLNLALVYGLGLGIAGSALGTLVAQLGSALALVWVVVRAARASGAPLAPDLPGIRAAGRAGVPLLLRTLTLRVSLLVMTYGAARLGERRPGRDAAGDDDLDVPRLRARRDRDRRPGDHRPLARSRRRARHACGHRPDGALRTGQRVRHRAAAGGVRLGARPAVHDRPRGAATCWSRCCWWRRSPSRSPGSSSSSTAC